MSAVPSSRSAFVMTSAGDGTVAKKVLATTPAASEPFIADLDKAHDDVIELANGRFGYNGWSSSIQNMKVDSIRPLPSSPTSVIHILVLSSAGKNRREDKASICEDFSHCPLDLGGRCLL